MSEATFEAATVEAALEAASSEMNAAVADLDYEVVEKKEDFWGMGDETVVIRAWERSEPEDEQEAPAEAPAEVPAEAAAEPPAEAAAEPPAEAADEPVPAVAAADDGKEEESTPPPSEQAESRQPDAALTESEPPTTEARAPERPAEAEGRRDAKDVGRGERDVEDVESTDISGMLEQIFHDMEFECTVEVEAEEEGFLATVDGADKDAILEGNGRCLSALELLVNNAFRHRLPEGSKIRVDAGDFRNKRDEELSDLAFQVAHSAKQSGRTQETQPLNPYERRLVHLALAEDPAVTTRSRGSGFLKNVQVIPSGGGHDRSRGRRR